MSGARTAVDADARARALETTSSFVVTAPAGSGKTELLTQRLLALLAIVDEPEEVLAITFTRKAAGEMRGRVLGALQLAAEKEPPPEAHRLQTWKLARAVLQRDGERNWSLQSNPARLRLQTIDSLCQRIAKEQPVLSLLGGALQPQNQPQRLYQQAVDALLAGLDHRHAGDSHLRLLANFYHGDLRKLSSMFVAMLGIREQWLPSMVQLSADQTAIDSLQHCLEKWSGELLVQARERLQDYAPALCVIAGFAGANVAANPELAAHNPIARLRGLQCLPEPSLSAMPAWRGLLALLLKADLAIRAKVDKRQGFPVDARTAKATVS
ncbi:MAG: UvrD-helicase domain-containing protein, partial [Pseudomonadales bacterium]|nr:UvrD-helicase domain-containing protein [Pseudomonadales bacterium]